MCSVSPCHDRCPLVYCHQIFFCLSISTAFRLTFLYGNAILFDQFLTALTFVLMFVWLVVYFLFSIHIA